MTDQTMWNPQNVNEMQDLTVSTKKKKNVQSDFGLFRKNGAFIRAIVGKMVCPQVHIHLEAQNVTL